MDAPPALVAPVPPIPLPGDYTAAYAHVSRGGVAVVRVGPGALSTCPAGCVPFRTTTKDSGLSPGLYLAYRRDGKNVLEPIQGRLPEVINAVPALQQPPALPRCTGPNCPK